MRHCCKYSVVVHDLIDTGIRDAGTMGYGSGPEVRKFIGVLSL